MENIKKDAGNVEKNVEFFNAANNSSTVAEKLDEDSNMLGYTSLPNEGIEEVARYLTNNLDYLANFREFNNKFVVSDIVKKDTADKLETVVKNYLPDLEWLTQDYKVFVMPFNNDDFYILISNLHGDYVPDKWKEVDRKSVLDYDGFYTDYTWYTDGNKHIFIFGDNDLYDPNDDYTDFDYECDDYSEAQEWFDDYKGFEEDEDFLDVDESLETIKLTYGKEIKDLLTEDYCDKNNHSIVDVIRNVDSWNDFIKYANEKGYSLTESVSKKTILAEDFSTDQLEEIANDLSDYCMSHDLYLEYCDPDYDYQSSGHKKNTIIAGIFDGDWKHEHQYFKTLMFEFFSDEGYAITDLEEKTVEEENEDSDTYSAEYIITIAPYEDR